MNLNQITANLNILATIVRSIDLKCRMSKISDANKKEFGLDIKYSKPVLGENTKIGRLLMTINISILQENSELQPDTIELIIEGVFSSTNDISDDDFLNLLNINGGAALYSIARAKIEALSSLTYSEGKVLLPMINIVQYYQEKNASEQPTD